MCGIVLVGSSTMSRNNVGFFEKMLFADTFRGPHSTGVFTSRIVTEGGQKIQVNPLTKLAVEGPEFLQTDEWELVRDGTIATWDATKQKYTSPIAANYGNYYVGHNRWATVGAVNAKNAHPFRHGQITMVHNGTLVDQDLLPESKRFEVDSENVCYSLSTWGVDKTIQNLDGAFTLIWHNNETDTLHIIRNEERPFHLAETHTGDWYGASEEDMMMWILKRGKVKPSIKQHFETKVGVEYIFDVANGKFSFKEERKHELPKFTTYSYGNWGRYTGSYGNSGSNWSGSTNTSNVHSIHTSHDARMKEAGLKYNIGDKIRYWGYDFTPYVTTTDIGRLEGYLDDITDYVQIINHSMSAHAHKGEGYYEGIIRSTYLQNNMLHIIVDRSTQVADNTGTALVVIEPEEAEEEETFNCSGCGEEFSDIHMSETCPYLCKDCFTTYYGGTSYSAPEKKTLLSGRVISKMEWEQDNQCSCGEVIDWQDAETTHMESGFVVCETCVHVMNQL